MTAADREEPDPAPRPALAGAGEQEPRAATGPGVRRVVPREAIEQLYAEHGLALRHFAEKLGWRYRLPDPRRDAEDAVQAVFAAAIEQWATLENVVAWMYAVTRNQMVRLAREAYRQGAVDDDVLHTQACAGPRWTSIAPRPDPDDEILARQVVAAIARIGSDRQRIATYLRHVQQWTADEIAELLHCAPSTVWTHTHRGVDAVRKEFPFTAGSDHSAPEVRAARSRSGWYWVVPVTVLLVGALAAEIWTIVSTVTGSTVNYPDDPGTSAVYLTFLTLLLSVVLVALALKVAGPAARALFVLIRFFLRRRQ